MMNFIKWQIVKIGAALGYNRTPWLRVEQHRMWRKEFGRISPEKLSVLEISPGLNETWKEVGFKSYSTVEYPDFDICSMVMNKKFDLIIADNVFEHINNPAEAVKNVYAMLQPDGIFLIATPFLFKFHPRPGDYYRWTKHGLLNLLVNSGFQESKTEVFSWGNRSCVRANLDKIIPYGWYRRMHNENEFPIMVWGIAKK